MQLKVMLSTFTLCQVLWISAVAGLGCPKIPVVKDFSVKDFIGIWYQQASLGTLPFQGLFGSCAKAEYSLGDSPNIVKVFNSQKGLFGEEHVKGTAVLANPESKEGQLTVTLDTLVGKQTADLLVLTTDYKNYAILYSCKSYLMVPQKAGWIVTRKQKLEGDDKKSMDKMIEEAFNEINKNNDTPKRADFKETPQNSC